jgi:type I restriction enzyme S subunit
MKLKKYDSYKDSGIEWIGEIPSHWELKPLKHLVFCNKDSLAENTNAEIEINYIEIGDVSSIDGIKDTTTYQFEKAPSRARRIVKEGDVIISTVRTYLKAITSISSKFDGYIASTGFAVLTPKLINSGFLGKLVLNEGFIGEIISLSKGVSYPSITASDLTNIKIPIPESTEQTAIANYLDQKTTQIDNLIAKKERLIQLLEEERTAIINQAVTKGLDPNVPMKDSGIEWLGEIPEHWEIKRIGHISKVVRGASPRPAGDPLLFNGAFLPWITVKEVTNAEGKYIVSTETYLTEEGSKHTRIIEPETLLLSNSGATLGVPRITKIRGGINDGSVAFLNLQVQRDYLYYFFLTHTKIYRDEVSGYGQPNLNTDIVKSTKVPLPNQDEQFEIVSFIENYIARFEDLMNKTTEEIELLKEYKTALISEVVTGKVDVRNEKLN